MRICTLALLALLLLPSASWADGYVFELTDPDLLTAGPRDLPPLITEPAPTPRGGAIAAPTSSPDVPVAPSVTPLIYIGHVPDPGMPRQSVSVGFGDTQAPEFTVRDVLSAETSLLVGVGAVDAEVVDISLVGPSTPLPDIPVWPVWAPVTVPIEYRMVGFLTFRATFDNGSEFEFDIQLVARGPELLSIFMFNPQPEPPARASVFETQTEGVTPPDDNIEGGGSGVLDLQTEGVTPPDDNIEGGEAELLDLQTEGGPPPTTTSRAPGSRCSRCRRSGERPRTTAG